MKPFNFEIGFTFPIGTEALYLVICYTNKHKRGFIACKCNYTDRSIAAGPIREYCPELIASFICINKEYRWTPSFRPRSA
jgi:hypothetical protein